MASKKRRMEEVIRLLREADVMLSQGQTVKKVVRSNSPHDCFFAYSTNMASP